MGGGRKCSCPQAPTAGSTRGPRAQGPGALLLQPACSARGEGLMPSPPALPTPSLSLTWGQEAEPVAWPGPSLGAQWLGQHSRGNSSTGSPAGVRWRATRSAGSPHSSRPVDTPPAWLSGAAGLAWRRELPDSGPRHAAQRGQTPGTDSSLARAVLSSLPPCCPWACCRGGQPSPAIGHQEAMPAPWPASWCPSGQLGLRECRGCRRDRQASQPQGPLWVVKGA